MVIVIVFTPVFSQAQCIDIQEPDYRIDINQFGQGTVIEIEFGTDLPLSEFTIQLYNFDNARYYVDESGQNTTIDNDINYNVTGSVIEFNNVPEGDFGIIMIQSGCKEQIVGFGYSGFPDSAIRTGG